MYVLLCYAHFCLHDDVMSLFLKCHLIQHTIILHWITLIFNKYIFSACPKKICVMDLSFCSEYTKFVIEALELEDTIKNYERRETTGWFVLTYSFSQFFSLFIVALLTVNKLCLYSKQTLWAYMIPIVGSWIYVK